MKTLAVYVPTELQLQVIQDLERQINELPKKLSDFIQLLNNDSTGTATKTDLGASFPRPSTDKVGVY